MTAPLPLGLTLSVSNSHPGCGRNSCGDSNGPCWMCRESQIWKEGAMAGARAVIARMRELADERAKRFASPWGPNVMDQLESELAASADDKEGA